MYPEHVYCMANWTNEEKQLYMDSRVFEIDFTPKIDIYHTYNVFNKEIEYQHDRDKSEKMPIPDSVKKFESWKWAYCTFLQRSTGVTKDSWNQLKHRQGKYADRFEDGFVIVPFFDFVNHAPLSMADRATWKNETIQIDTN